MNKFSEFNLKSDGRVEAYRLGNEGGSPSLMLTAGVHGGENTPVQAAYEFLDFLKTEPINGRITIIPIVNVDGFARNSRENPSDGKNINTAGQNGNGGVIEYSLSDSIADEVIKMATQHDYFLDLHSASKSRYLLHVYYHDEKDIELARQFGFRFVVPHFSSKRGQAINGELGFKPIGLRVREANSLALTLEIGGGVMVRRKDVKQGLAGLKNFARHVGILDDNEELAPTPEDQVFTRKRDEITTVVKAPGAGDLFFCESLGKMVKKGDTVAYIIDLETRERHNITAPVTGRLILKRILSRINEDEVGKETIFRLMPGRA